MKLNRLCAQLATCAAFAMTASAAHAGLYTFSLTGSATASWQIDSSPMPSSSNSNEFEVQGITGSFNGVSGPMSFFFAEESFGGGLEIRSTNGGFIADGPQLYTGATAMPTFKLDTFELTQFGGAGSYSLTISEAAAVPEPATLALVLGGLGLVGATSRRRREG